MMDPAFQEREWGLNTETIQFHIGPFHPDLPGPLLLKLELDGEVISSCDFESGFVKRDLEKCIESNPWTATMPYCDRLDPEAAVFGELAMCMAVEKLCRFSIPERAVFIRSILCELTRMSAHLLYLSKIAQSVRSESIVHFILRDREKILDLFELIAGARFSLNYFCFGGVTGDVTEGFLERVQDVCDLIQARLREYDEILVANRIFLARAAHLAVVDQERILELGITGPNARASGVNLDIRKIYPYLKYDELDFRVPMGTGEWGELGDTVDRVVVRFREIFQSLDLIRQLVDRIPRGDYWNADQAQKMSIPKGESYVRVESPRGFLGCHLVSNGKSSPFRVRFRVPSLTHLFSIREMIKGTRLDDVPLALHSLDLSIAEVDR